MADLSAERELAPTRGLKGYHLFRILGFDVRLNLTWLLLALLITWTLAAGLIILVYPSGPTGGWAWPAQWVFFSRSCFMSYRIR